MLSANLGVLTRWATRWGRSQATHPRTSYGQTDGGTDPIYLQGYQILPGRLGPVATSVSVTVYPFMLYVNGQWMEIGNVTLSLSSACARDGREVPDGLISVDTSGNLVQTAGSEVDLAAWRR